MNSQNSQKELQDFILDVLRRNHLSIEWLADKLNLDYDIVHYQLKRAKNYRSEFHQKCIQLFKSEKLISEKYDDLNELKDKVIQLDYLINGGLSLFERNLQLSLQDNYLDEKEKQELEKLLKELKDKIEDQINNFILTIQLK